MTKEKATPTVETKPTPETPPPTEKTVQTGQEAIEGGEIVDKAPKRSAYIEMAQDEAEQWHWCLWSSNGRAMAGSMITYGKRNDCMKAIEAVISNLKDGKIKIVAQVGE